MEQEKIILRRVTTSHGELQLQQLPDLDEKGHPLYEVIFNGVFLMASYNKLSERKAAALAIEPLVSNKEALRALIAGLGIGYSLRAALDYESVREVDVVEIEEHIIRWAMGLFSKQNGDACSDPRVSIIEMDLGDYIMQTDKTYDAIVVDVDNGPTWLALESNESLYEEPCLRRFKARLTDGGVLTVWAAQKCEEFQNRLERVFGRAELITVQDVDGHGRQIDYYIYRTRWLRD